MTMYKLKTQPNGERTEIHPFGHSCNPITSDDVIAKEKTDWLIESERATADQFESADGSDALADDVNVQPKKKAK